MEKLFCKFLLFSFDERKQHSHEVWSGREFGPLIPQFGHGLWLASENASRLFLHAVSPPSFIIDFVRRAERLRYRTCRALWSKSTHYPS
jgi:hypothetical protein